MKLKKKKKKKKKIIRSLLMKRFFFIIWAGIETNLGLYFGILNGVLCVLGVGMGHGEIEISLVLSAGAAVKY